MVSSPVPWAKPKADNILERRVMSSPQLSSPFINHPLVPIDDDVVAIAVMVFVMIAEAWR